MELDSLTVEQQLSFFKHMLQTCGVEIDEKAPENLDARVKGAEIARTLRDYKNVNGVDKKTRNAVLFEVARGILEEIHSWPADPAGPALATTEPVIMKITLFSNQPAVAGAALSQPTEGQQ